MRLFAVGLSSRRKRSRDDEIALECFEDMLYSMADRSCWFDERRSKMKELVRLRMRPSRNGKTFRYVLDYADESGKRPDQGKYTLRLPLGYGAVH